MGNYRKYIIILLSGLAIILLVCLNYINVAESKTKIRLNIFPESVQSIMPGVVGRVEGYETGEFSNSDIKNKHFKYYIVNKSTVNYLVEITIIVLVMIILTLTLNIIKIHKMQSLLLNSQRQYKELVESIPNAVISLKQGQLEFINQHGLALLGVPKKEELTQELLEKMLLHKIDLTHLSSTPTYKTETIKILNGDLKEIEFITVLNKDDEDSIIIILQDISYRKLLYETKERERIRAELFTNLSHELKTPINLVLSTTQLLESVDDEEYIKRMLPKSIKVLKRNSYRLLRLVNNIIDSTRLEDGHLKIHKNNCDIVQITEDVTLSTINYAKQNKVEVIFNTEVEELEVALDVEKYERIILNLLSNAIKYNKQEGKIEVNLLIEGEHVVVEVKDTGIGISEEALPCLFKRFTRVNTGSSSRVEGNGLGLSLVKSLIEQHKGTIDVESIQGVGSKFSIRLPIDKIECSETSSMNVIKDYKTTTQIELSDLYLE